MKISAGTAVVLISAVIASLGVHSASGSSNYKCKNPSCDINAIGHRTFFDGPSVGNWYSIEKEKELGAKHAATVEKEVEILKDSAVADYVDRVAQRIAQNSDADIPITVRIIRRGDVGAFTLFGGHLYLTTGLLLKLHSEGELASVLARGIAHTAMHSVARLQTREVLLETAGTPMIGIDGLPRAPGANDFVPRLGELKFQRDFELEADYFGIQYVYKSGYDTECFLNAVQTVWTPGQRKASIKAFDPFPPLADRMKMLHQEIDDILPKVPGAAAVSTPEFDEFIGRLRQIVPETIPVEDDQPKLVRHDSVAAN